MLKPYYETGYDLHVANYIAYADTDKKLYEDETHKIAVKKNDMERVFKLGRLMIQTADAVLLPFALTSAGVVCHDGSSAETFTAED